jgi:hypothetical protein
MNLAYPIQAILFYLALFFAPADTERIVFKGVDHSGVLIRDATGWNLVGSQGNIQVSIDGTRFVSGGKSGSYTLELLEYVPGLAGHDWAKQPKLSLPEATTLEKTPSGFKLRNDRGTEGIYEYTISYVRKDRPGGPTCNVLGAVQQPGVIALLDGDTLSSVVLRAGGYSGQTTPPVARILAGKPGERLSNRGEFVLGVEGPAPNPAIRDGDTIYVAPTVLLELARDGSLSIDGKACPAAEIPARLRDRVEAGARSATLQTHRDTPLATVQSVGDACIKAGIPADRLKLDRSTAAD